jgi:hypothetical protein
MEQNMVKQKPKLVDFTEAMKRFRTGVGKTEKTVAKKDATKKQTVKTVDKEEQLTRIERNPANKDDFDKLVFVCKACSENSTRGSFATVIHVERTRAGCRIVATDGRRLHVAECKLKIASGDYKPFVTKEIVDIGKPVPGILFPNWSRVIPNDITKKVELNLVDTGIGADVRQTDKMAQAYSVFLKKTGTVINLSHLDDLPKTEWIVYAQKEKNKALMFKQKADPDGAYAVIMPLLKAA